MNSRDSAPVLIVGSPKTGARSVKILATMGTICCQSFNLCDEGRCGLEMPDEHLQRA